MILYNITVNINHDVHDDWLSWMREVHMPDVMKTGLFTEKRLCRLYGDEDSGGVTYSVQYVCRSMEDYEAYQHAYAPDLQAEHASRYRDKFVAFRSLLEIID